MLQVHIQSLEGTCRFSGSIAVSSRNVVQQLTCKYKMLFIER